MTSHDAAKGSFTKQTLQPGSGLRKPNEWSMCRVFITPESSVIDEQSIGYPVNVECEISLGSNIGVYSSQVDRCIESMRSGEKCKLVITKNSKNVDTCDEQILMIHLIEFTRSKDVWEMTTEEKISRANLLKDLGTKYFKDGRIEQAELYYLRGLKYVIASQKGDKEKLLLSLNVAACHLKLARYRDVIVHCTNVLNIDSNNTKALFRRGQAFMELQEYEQAAMDLEQCLSSEPNNKAVQKQLELLTGKKRKLDAHFASAMSKMFGGAPSESKH